MKNFLLLIAGVSAAAACFLITRPSRASRSIDDLAHELQGAWADHRTVA
jgi:hypothetical protein